MLRRVLAVSIAILAVVGANTSGGGVARAEGVHFVGFTRPAPGPLGSVTFLGDSVGIGAGRYAPTLPDQLAARGWGPVRFQAVDGGRTGYPPGWPDYFNAVPLIDQWQAEGWDSDTWILNLGANDSGYCSADVACARAAIMLVVEAIGPGHRIWWPKITRLYTHQYQADAWNMALDQIDAERDDFWTWDWPSEMSSHPDTYGSWDHTHLYPDGYRLRSAVMAQAFTDAVAVGHRVGGDVPLPPAIGSPAAIVAVDPTRVLDTRLVPGGREPPLISNVNVVPGDTNASAGFVRVGEGSSICIHTNTDADVIVDLTGTLQPSLGLVVVPAEPRRLLDTRSAIGGWSPLHGGGQTFDIGAAPPDARAVTGTLTLVTPLSPSYLAASPCGTVTATSSVNAGAGTVVANSVTVAVSPGDGRLCLAARAAGHTVFDLTGWWVAS